MSDNDKNGSYFNDEDARIIAERVAAIKAQKAAKAKQQASVEAPTKAVEREVSETAKANAEEVARQQAEARKRAADIARRQAEQARLETEAKSEARSEDKEELLSAFEKLDEEKKSSAEGSGFKYKMVDSETAEIDTEVSMPEDKPVKKVDTSKSSKSSKGGKKSGKSKLPMILLILAAVLLLAAAGMIAYYFMSGGQNSPFYSVPKEQALTGAGHTYTVDSPEKLTLYLKHPSLLPGDTIVLANNIDLDVNENFNGYLSMPLINFDTSGGRLNLNGGTVVMSSGRSDSVSLDGVNINSNVYIEAPNANLTWSGASAFDSNIDVATLNGSSHTKNLSLKAVGTKFTVPVTVSNSTSGALANAEVTFFSDAFVFCDGKTITVENIPANGSVTLDVPVIATQGGRHNITASGQGISGSSAYVDILGTGYYTGDVNIYTYQEKYYEQYPHAVDVARKAYSLGFSFVGSTGKSAFGELPTESELNSIRGSDRFIVNSNAEMVTQDGGVMFIGYPTNEELPSVDYEKIDGVPLWTFQDTVRQGYDLGAAGIITHPFTFGIIQDKIDQIRVTRQFYGINIIEPGAPYDSMEWRVGMNVWDNINSLGRMRAFATGSSSTADVGCIGYAFIGGYLGDVSDDALVDLIKNGNYYAGNGPSLTFELGGKHMAESFTAKEGEPVSLKVSAYAESPLKSVTLYRYDVTYSTSDLHPETVYSVDLSGQGKYSYSDYTTISVVPTSYYRLVVVSEQPKVAGADEVGYAVSNPIFIDPANENSANASITSISYLGDSSKDTSELKMAEDGTYYIQCNGGLFSPAGITVESTGTSSIDYHVNESDLFPDYVTIHVVAADGKSSTSERIYIVE